MQDAHPYLSAHPDEPLLMRPGKWSLVVIVGLRGGPRRFGELRRNIDRISQKTLTKTLRDLERDGCVRRTQFAGIPPRVEYELTSLGLGFLEFAESWTGFVADHRDEIERARASFAVPRATAPRLPRHGAG